MVTKAELEKLTVVKLKDKLSDLGLDTAGRKAELINRLLKADKDGKGTTTRKTRGRKVIEEEESSSENESEGEEMEEEPQEDFSKFTVPKLRQMCKKRGLDTTGRKGELVARLEGGDGEEEEDMDTAEAAEEVQTKKRTRAQAKPARRSTRKPKKIEESESESESEDESSSEEEAPAKRPSSPKNVGKATIDKCCHLSGNVFGEYDCMLNQVSFLFVCFGFVLTHTDQHCKQQ